MPHCLLLSHWERHIGKGPCGPGVFGHSECGSHEVDAVIIRWKVASTSYRDFDLSEGLKYCCVVLASQKSRINSARDERVELAFGKKTSLAVCGKDFSRLQPLAAPCNKSSCSSRVIAPLCQKSFV